MKCPTCNLDNKETAKNCKKCNSPLVIVSIWSPTWLWHMKTLGIIYASLMVIFLLLNWFLGPYLRDLPPEVTPWLHRAGQIHK